MAANPPQKIQRGEIWLINFDPQIGSEISKIRPAVVMNILTAGRLPLHIVVPITTGSLSFKNYFWMVSIAANKANGLEHDSYADAFQIKSISVDRFVSRLGSLSQSRLDEIAAAIVLCIGYTPPKES